MTGPTETLSPALPADVEKLAMRMLEYATARELKIATAESCTGGLLASLLTDVEGCGHCFERGFITYSDDSKAEMLGVSRAILDHDGAVSRRAAEAMVLGAIAHSKADIAVSITGYAGPGAADEEEGLVFIAVGGRDRSVSVAEYHFGSGGRGDVRLRCLRASLTALIELMEYEPADASTSG